MTTQSQIHSTAAPRRRPRTVAVVSSHAHPAVQEVLGAVDHDVVVIESTMHAYTQIKRVAPDLVILCLSGEDESGCQLLSMLTLDGDTARIPVLTHIFEPTSSAYPAGAFEDDMLRAFVPGSLN